MSPDYEARIRLFTGYRPWRCHNDVAELAVPGAIRQPIDQIQIDLASLTAGINSL
jgi:hypothetical protein